MLVVGDLELVQLFREREEHDPLTNAYSYLTGRIDEYCAQHGIGNDDYELARRAATRT